MQSSITMEAWLNQRKAKVKGSSLKTYKSYEQAHLLPFFGDTPLKDIRRKKIRKFKKHLGKKLAPKTVKDILSYLRTLLKAAEKKGYLKSPEMPKVRVQAREKEILDRRDHQALSERVRQSQNPQDMAVYISLSLGLRIGEVLGLRIKDVDLEGGVLRVRKNRQRVYDPQTGRYPVVSLSPKTRSSIRDIPIAASVKAVLSRFLESRDHTPKKLLITGKNGRPCDTRSVQYHFAGLKKELGLSPKLTFHSLRHSFATRALEAGAEMNTLSAFLGHASVSFTLSRYGHCVTAQKREQMEKIAACF
ncbi:site-specific integrase [Eubacterium sp. 1001713B170207_170306_E7]|uniref:tyrosine-type recombinase/integrase n=1 Tax=Eubacterium sp. 1001713B170207_170306_E7 TaxID=2787097 RepID=UPI00189BC70A|nr:site-specific integrase [Eubacterium sp. 1001713B170207_170306_E7]